MLAEAARSDSRKLLLWAAPALVAILTAILIAKRGMFDGIAAGSVTTLLILLRSSWQLTTEQRKIVTGNLNRWSTPTTTLTLTDRHITLESAAQTTIVHWNKIDKLSRHKHYWNLHLSDERTVHMIPTESIPQTHRDFILAQTQAHGGKVA